MPELLGKYFTKNSTVQNRRTLSPQFEDDWQFLQAIEGGETMEEITMIYEDK